MSLPLHDVPVNPKRPAAFLLVLEWWQALGYLYLGVVTQLVRGELHFSYPVEMHLDSLWG